jgi:CDP-diacylglycerol--glycerol-3-phosphate 3-phosphatidyltransferase
MTLPNKLTIGRILAVPAMVTVAYIPYLRDTNMFTIDGVGCLTIANFINFILFILASFTDFLDGKIARKYNLVTTFRKFADPLADKMLVLTSILILMTQGLTVRGWPSELGITPLWAVAIILIRELMVSGIRLVAAQKGIVIAAGWAGKVKTFVTMVALEFFFLATIHISIAIIALILVYASVILTVYSGVVYFINAKDMLLESV